MSAAIVQLPIISTYDPPPIPMREFDWHSVRDGWEPGAPEGYGRTRQEAEAALLVDEEDRA